MPHGAPRGGMHKAGQVAPLAVSPRANNLSKCQRLRSTGSLVLL
jgi:hypothetical protein